MSRDPYEDDLAAIANIGVVRNILDVVCHSTGMGFSAVARVTDERWVACAVRDDIGFGLLPGGELEIRSTICDEIRQSGCLVVIDEVATDERFRDHPTPKRYGFQSYISVPIRLPDGRFFGTLCAIDPRPARLDNTQTVDMFKLFAELIGLHLDAQQRLVASEAALETAREKAELQNQFVAVLGHDLRNPLSAIQTGAKMLAGMPLEQRAANIASVIARSTTRMTGLVDNVLDFARTRLGGGLVLTLQPEEELGSMLYQVITEMRTIHPRRTIHSRCEITGVVRCDSARVGQLFSNLLANALTHGDPEAPVLVSATDKNGRFELCVSNRGADIDPSTAGRLFQPFVRGADRPDSQGLGLGLYIASEIARAHGGAIEIASAAGETRFTFVMPHPSEI